VVYVGRIISWRATTGRILVGSTLEDAGFDRHTTAVGGA